ncbi:MAG: prepilin-type N-terminal cleavage/methylation domain-containing protein [Coriobacteriales bacterium]|jgi:type IV pilus assembly protein PilA|nr:prepilin-type N-terminal cleavage/methylation domain-containing protein [Coriobacteriales bacterium]
MKNMIAKRLALKASDKKGFTLIEVIVVLVILGIMAALIVPALTGYIEKAHQRTVVTEAATYRTSLQAIGTDTVASGGDPTAITTGSSVLPDEYMPVSDEDTPTVTEEINALVGNEALDAADLTGIVFTGTGQLTNFVYTNGTYTATYSDGSYEVAPVTPSN